MNHARTGERQQRIVDHSQMIGCNDAPPVRGMFWSPSATGLKRCRATGPSVLMKNQYNMLSPPTCLIASACYSEPMTDLNNSNDGEETKPHDSGRNGGDSSEISEEAAWNRFLDEYSDDLGDVERSRTARKFDRHATRQEKREEKKAILSVNDLKQGSFVDSSGPRDFTQSSWLDTDDVMDRGSVFTPPIPIWVRFAGRVSSAASCSSWASPASSPRRFCRPGRPCSASSSASRYSSAPVACSSHTAAMTRPSGMRRRRRSRIGFTKEQGAIRLCTAE